MIPANAFRQCLIRTPFVSSWLQINWTFGLWREAGFPTGMEMEKVGRARGLRRAMNYPAHIGEGCPKLEQFD
jgi:hypothetical protein